MRHTLIAATLTLLAGPALAAPAPASGSDPIAAALQAKDFVTARRLAEAGAAKGDPEAMNNLALLLTNGMGGPADPKRGAALRERALAAGSTTAKLNVAITLATGPDRSQWPRAIKLLEDVAKDPKLASAVYYPAGRIFLLSGKNPAEIRQGVEMMRKAIETDPAVPDAQFLVARAYQNGWGGTEKSDTKAFEHYVTAARLGDARALRSVALAQLEGRGVAKNPTAAMAGFRAAADKGQSLAMVDMALMLSLGEGVRADPVQARSWYLKAANMGSAHALRGLGVMLYDGQGGAVDRATGRAYLELAAAAGDDQAPALARERFGAISGGERAGVDRIKADWLRTHPAPKPD